MTIKNYQVLCNGKYSGTEITYKKIFEVPNFKDFVEICIIIVIFAFAQGVLTNWFIMLYALETNQINKIN